MSKFQNKKFKDMSNEELCATSAKLKFQLVEARFKLASGELEKINVMKQIRKTIAQIFTELANRGFKVTIGNHGVTMYDLKTNKPFSLDSKKLQSLINNDNSATRKQNNKQKKVVTKNKKNVSTNKTKSKETK